MRIALYAPLKPPDHPTPSGDRAVARLLMRALRAAGHEVEVASRLRSFSREPSEAARSALLAAARAERDRLLDGWRRGAEAARPALWLSYHPYYKAPDLLGPGISSALAIPYATAEASFAGKRDRDAWAPWQADVVAAVRSAAVSFCVTARDRQGLERIAGRRGRLVDLPPFIDLADWPAVSAGQRTDNGPLQLVTVAMMRPGDKLQSYRMLAAALATIPEIDWMLTVIGDGPCRDDVHAAFAALPAARIRWLGEQTQQQVREALARCDLYVWPGYGEAYGLAYLEAQAMGLAVVAQAMAGVPEVVRHGETGLLTEPGDIAAYAAAIATLARDRGRLRRMAGAAQHGVRERHSLPGAARILAEAIAGVATTKAGQTT